MKREDVEAILRDALESAGRAKARLCDMTFSIEGDTLEALCCAWLALYSEVDPVITQDEFVRQSGDICPACGGRDVEAIEPVRAAEAGYARMPVKCVECLATWEEEYALRGFVSLEGY